MDDDCEDVNHGGVSSFVSSGGESEDAREVQDFVGDEGNRSGKTKDVDLSVVAPQKKRKWRKGKKKGFRIGYARKVHRSSPQLPASPSMPNENEAKEDVEEEPPSCLGCWYMSPPHEEIYENIVEAGFHGTDFSESSLSNDDTAASQSDSPSEENRNQEGYCYSPPMDIGSQDTDVSPSVRKLFQSASIQEYSCMHYLEPWFLESLHENMILLLSEKWTITSFPECLRLTYLSDRKNPHVEKAIVFDEKGFNIYVHQKSLPEEHHIWRQQLKHSIFIGEVSDTLKKVADMVEAAAVCPGITQYKELWKEASGTVENEGYNTIPCFRPSSCKLLCAKICEECKRRRNLFSSKSYRRKHGKKNPKHCNNRYLNVEELKGKVVTTQDNKRKQEKKLQRLKFRVDQLLKKNNLSVGKGMHKDLKTILEENKACLTYVQQLFWEQQEAALQKQGKRRSMRWNPMMIRIALHLQMKAGDAAYEYLQNFIELPSKRTLYDYSHFVDAKEGLQTHNIEELRKKVKNFIEDHQKFFNLQLDEMYIRSDLVMSRKTGQIIGYTHLSKLEQELKDFNAELLNQPIGKPTLAKKVLCYMVNGITNDVVLPVVVYPVNDISAGQLYTRSWDVILNLEMRGIKVLTVTCDGASINKKFYSMHTSCDELCDFVYVTKNIACGENRPIYFFVDPPHIIKTVRNCLANSYAHRQTRQLWKEGSTLSWKTIEALYELCLASTFSGLKLTKDHVKLNSFSCMKVMYASQIFSLSVYNALHKYKTTLEDKGHNIGELSTLIFLMNRFFDCFNANDDPGKRNKVISDLRPYTSADERLAFMKEDFLNFFKVWDNSVKERPGTFSKTKREMMMISRQSVESLKISIYSLTAVVSFLLQSGATSVCSRKISQDKLEQFFGLLRMSSGANNNPDIAQVLQKCVTLQAQGQAAAPSKKGNTSLGTSRSIEVDDAPLPKRPRPGRHH